MLNVNWNYDHETEAGWVNVNGITTYEGVLTIAECAAIAFAIMVTQKTAWDEIEPYVQLLLNEQVECHRGPAGQGD